MVRKYQLTAFGLHRLAEYRAGFKNLNKAISGVSA
jgi:hypothetical protein